MKHCIAVWVFLLLGGNAHAQQQWSIELGYLRAFHKDLGVTQQDWILVDGTWTDPANLSGQSTYAFTFRDTSWFYGFNHDLPIFTSRIPLSVSKNEQWELDLIQSVLWNSWRQIAFMAGLDFRFHPHERISLGIQGGLLSGYHDVNDLLNPTLEPLEGEGGGTLLGVNATVDVYLSEHWAFRVSYNPLVKGLGLLYKISPKK